MYRGQLKDGSFIAIRCLKIKRNHSTQHFMSHVQLLSKLRHHHLVSALGHCFGYYLDDSSVSRVFLVFEYAPNGTLRSWISVCSRSPSYLAEKHISQKLTWAQRIAAATGVAKGVQFLQTGIVPGLFSNNLKITEILLDQNLAAKISSYNLPLLAEYMGKLLASVIADDASRNSVVDPVIKSSCSNKSLKTMMDICCRCLHEDPLDRPSIEDVLWHLQFARQVQDGSPISPILSRLKLTIKQ
ncbi:putative inactive leucine-rich repeat receptor-like protein kinase [Forsythia ovata]|uniref:Inactive leucine-rich repeat receptor-like protein kinase n=1 Tax=Forsythia ovata TaxID=205694 RepID=A0ABD1SR45_9LAMI